MQHAPDEDDSALVIESDDDAALEIVDYVECAAVRTSQDPRFRTEVVAESTEVPRQVFERIRDAIESHRAAVHEGVFRATDICVSVDRYDPGSRFLRYMFPFFAGAARVKISVSGTVNGESIDAEMSATRSIGAFGGSSDTMLDACLQDCIGDIFSAIDKAAGREPPPFARFWGQLRIARWIAAAVVCVAFVVGFLVIHPANLDDKNGSATFAMIFGAVLASAATFGLVSLGGLIVAPRDFLLNHPAGMKAMTRTGVKSPIALRIVATLLFLISLGAIGLSLLCLVEGR